MTLLFGKSTAAAQASRARKTRLVSVLFALTMMTLLLLPSRALACACCVEPGEWYESSASVDASELAELGLLKFSPAATTYMTVQGEEGITGITPVSENYTLAVTQTRRRWTFAFRDDNRASGTLTFTVPPTAESFGADLHDPSITDAGPKLYKEWRFAGRVSGGTGIFKAGITPNTKFRLILQGRGNNCRSAADFRNWILQINGPRAAYAFYGTFPQQ